MARLRKRAILPPEIDLLLGNKETRCKNCGLSEQSYPVHPRGNFRSRVSFIGEAAGLCEEDGDLTFNGPAANKLDETLELYGIFPDRHFLMPNVALCRPHAPEGSLKENRQPSVQEIQACHPNLEAIITAQNPSLIVACGGVAAAALMKNYPGAVSKVAGKFFGPEENIFGIDADLFVIFHPSYILRNAMAEKEWRIQLVRLRDYMVANQMTTTY